MATVSALQYAKRKKAVYGKAARSNFDSVNFDSFFGDDELATSHTTVERQLKVKDAYPVQKTAERNSALKLAKPRSKQQDPFDVPSSDDEITSPIKSTVPLAFSAPKLVDDKSAEHERLASWEKRKADGLHEEEAAPKRSRRELASPETQLRWELDNATVSVERSSSTTRDDTTSKHTRMSTLSPARSVEPKPSSAAARLAARRKVSSGTALSSADESDRALIKHAPGNVDNAAASPRKRARNAIASRDDLTDVTMANTSPAPVCEMSSPDMKTDANVFDPPDSSADESSHTATSHKSRKPPKRSAKRNKPTTYSSRTTPRKGISASARLSEMLPADNDTTDPPTRSPSDVTSRKSTPQQPSTPPSGRLCTPDTATKAAATLTPKQAQLWSSLLPNDATGPSPSVLPMKDLSISARRSVGAHGLLASTLTKSLSDVPRRRVRLVDRLKASAPQSSSDSSDEESEDEQMIDAAPDVPLAVPETEVEKMGEMATKQTSQSQSTSAPLVGPKVTYARVRSFLPENSLEDDLLAGMVDDTPQHSATFARGNRRTQQFSQKSAFDLDDSDDELEGSGRIRTIHELRASGRNIRGMEDIEELLGDIGKHGAAQRSRRRGALMELATKLAQKDFAERFVSHSFEARLAAECNAATDDIADFLLATAFALITSSELPEHAVRTLHNQGVVQWLAQLLNKGTEISKIAKDRRNNISKAAQGSLLDFDNTLRNLAMLWDEQKPVIMTTRLIALKALDQLVGRLRRLGNKTELLGADELRVVLADPSAQLDKLKQTEEALGVSTLESLSTTSLALDWPCGVIKQIAEILPTLSTNTATSRRSLFLTLRLCVNLTNDHEKNCGLLAKDTIVSYLLRTIQSGFRDLHANDDETRTIALDLLVLSTSIMTSLAEHCDQARKYAVEESDTLSALVGVLQTGQKHMLEAESVEESISNVAYGYLAVMFANLCQHDGARALIASQLPGKNLGTLIEAVEEFVQHHQKVDTMNFEGEAGKEVWGAFTEKLRLVLVGLKEAELMI